MQFLVTQIRDSYRKSRYENFLEAQPLHVGPNGVAGYENYHLPSNIMPKALVEGIDLFNK